MSLTKEQVNRVLRMQEDVEQAARNASIAQFNYSRLCAEFKDYVENLEEK